MVTLLHIFAGGCTLSLIALAMEIVGVVTMRWYIIEGLFGANNLYAGLFEYCVGVTCSSIDHPTSFLKAVRALEIIGASGTFVGLVLAVVFFGAYEEERDNHAIRSIRFYHSIHCRSVFSEWSHCLRMSRPNDEHSYSYSFYLSLIGGSTAMLGGAIAYRSGMLLAAGCRSTSPPHYPSNIKINK